MEDNSLERLYRENRSLIFNRANYFALKTQIDKDEFISEGNLAFLICAKNYTPTNGTKFSTLLWKYSTQAMRNLISQNQPSLKFEHLEENNYYGFRNNGKNIKFSPENLSSFATETISIIVGGEITHLSTLTQILRQKKWKPQLIQSIYREIRDLINQGKRKGGNISQ